MAQPIKLSATCSPSIANLSTLPRDGEDAEGWYKRVIRTEIAPLLREYWFDAPTKADGWKDQLLAPL
jgi:hypothetical protein